MQQDQRKQICIADASADSVASVKSVLEKAGYGIAGACSSAAELISLLERSIPDLVVMDASLPGGPEIEKAHHALQSRDIPVIYLVEHADSIVIEQSRLAAPDGILVKPVNGRELISNINAALLRHARSRELKARESRLLKEKQRREIFGSMIGDSRAMAEVFEKAAAVFSRNLNVLVTGESGTGKELLARAIHNGSPRNGGPFVAINCAAISRELSESLLFGHRKGAFTGAAEDHPGYFEQAHGGTIFLDEIGDMNSEVQAKVLRVVEEKKLRRIGEKKERSVDVRILSATNRNLREANDAAAFREDLYYRLEEYTIHIPPLRERPEDIPVLAGHFLATFCEFYELAPMGIGSAAMKLLVAHSWPGNVRELKNVIQKAAVQAPGEIIDIMEIPVPSGVRKDSGRNNEARRQEPPHEESEILPLHELERRAIARAMDSAGGNIARAAALLGIGRATLYRKLEKLGLGR